MEHRWPCMSLQSRKVSIKRWCERVLRVVHAAMTQCYMVVVHAYHLEDWGPVGMETIMGDSRLILLRMPLVVSIGRAFLDLILQWFATIRMLD